MLAVAYAASIGGVATPIGTPPNLIAIGQLDTLARVRIPFLQWMLLGVPVMVVLLLMLVIYLRWALPPEVRDIPGSRELIAAERAVLGPWRVAEKNVALAFAITVTLWIAPGALALVVGTESATYRDYQAALPEGVVALLGAGLLFVLPVRWAERRFTIGWREAVRIDWGTLLLFGGGLALGGAMFRSGLGHAVGEAVVTATGARSPLALTYLFGAAALLLTETTSNTAAATMVCPLAIAAAQAAGVSPMAPAAAAALCCSMAFMLPVSTPPNAIAYSSGCVPITVMLRHGVLLDLCCLAIAPGAALLLCGALGW
jgi:sodium-dependent dicarboxylate transporter 2/3/5